MSEKRRALGRGLGALIPNAPTSASGRPVDVFFPDQRIQPATPEPPADTDGSADGTADIPADGTGETQVVPAADAVTAGGADGANAAVDAGGSNDDEAASDREELAPVPGASYGDLPILSIRPNPKQPRAVFDEDDMAELVHSIREIGVLQPIVVRPIPAGQGPDDLDSAPEGVRYELIMGERRWRASQEAGKSTIPAIVKETDDDDLLRDALLENLHRSQLNALEEAAAYQQLLEDFGCTHDELAGRIGRSRPQISNTLRLLKLPPLVARRVAAGVLSAGHARALLSLEDGAAMERLAQRIVAEGLSVRSVEEIVALGEDQERPAPRRPRAGNRHPQLDDLAARLSDRFDTRVNIALGQRKGKLTVEFASVEDLNRIVDLLGVDRSA
ncbi:ParB/RepB/Spo0J family partition protein [Phycicoccus sp. Soil748]|uniref:ParB/RepB/Spo0J family partition protein n=1 Tax=Phycicoccus sp. Soil748 TaxID=1736397 RepID=UPI000702E770|nr:ParB/RepB/Spo0J family partition protein [Phycicoccus sp. Soil748]KRE56075.1 chromosome partitioning protein ParB [Phycicoccus sp. Soil748]